MINYYHKIIERILFKYLKSYKGLKNNDLKRFFLCIFNIFITQKNI